MAGVWVADMSASKLSPALPMRDALIQIAVDEKSVTISSEIVDGSGRQQRGSETVPTTGELSAGTLTEGVTHRARWLDEDVLAVLAKKGGTVFLIVIYELSKDGRQLTVRSMGTLEQTVVFRRKG